MKKQILIKKIFSNNIKEELEKINFDKNYLAQASLKYEYCHFKIFNLSSPAANILKQLALSVGTDCAVDKKVIINAIEYSNCILSGNKKQLNTISQKLEQQPFKLKELAKLIKKQLEEKLSPLEIRKNTFDFQNKKYIMGILNITPDSFSDGGKYFDLKNAIKHALQLIADGADILDIGAESTRPLAESISAELEQKRLLPILKELRNINKDIIISIDTKNVSTAQKALELGADIINDVGFSNEEMFKFIGNNNIPYILMHSASLANNSDNLVENIYFDLNSKIEYLRMNGLEKQNLIIDPGIGFSKKGNKNFEILHKIKEFTSLNYPILIGHSRKSFLNECLNNNLTNENRDLATAIISTYLLTNNVSILRVHNVAQSVLVRNILTSLKI